MEIIRNYGIALVAFFLVDIVWLGVVARKLYDKYIGHLRADKTNWSAAIIFYLLYVLSLVFIVINPALEKESIMYAFLGGGLFGIITYSTYDLTNLATLKDWPVFITIVDIVWGMILNALTAVISFYIISLF
ncbi:MAG: DUF2177 family protein [Clostridium sp.]|nr:DUF2177 family protein [Clostridium sp.]